MEQEWTQQKQKILNSFVGTSQEVSGLKINMEVILLYLPRLRIGFSLSLALFKSVVLINLDFG